MNARQARLARAFDVRLRLHWSARRPLPVRNGGHVAHAWLIEGVPS